jgi:teichuronic acid exporter
MRFSSIILKGFIWSTIERFSIQFFQLVFGIILARILAPEEFGIVGLLLSIVNFIQIFIDSGFAKALIQKNTRTSQDLSSVFFLNIILGVGFYLMIYLLAPFLANFYLNPDLTNYLRIISFSLILNSIYIIPMTLFSIDLNFKVITKINLFSVLLSGIISLLLVYLNFGIWALIIQNISKSFFAMIFIWFKSNWRPIFSCSLNSITSLYKFGSNIFMSSIINALVDTFSNFSIAKLLSVKDLGFYSRGTQFTDIIFGTISTVMDSVLFPGLSKISNNKVELVYYSKFFIVTAALISIPILFLLAIVSKPLVIVLLTAKWVNAIPIMQIFCISRIISIISGVNVNFLYVIGRSDLAFRQNLLKIVIRILLVFTSFKFGILWIAIAELASTVIHFFINTYYSGKFMNFGAIDQLRHIFPIFMAGVVMGIVSIFFAGFFENNYLKITVSIITSLITYITIIYFLRIEQFNAILYRIKEKNVLS